ncbi:hypothetical protein NFI96_000369 [Prochilodus magdalenae]|nr:hypothetical protein NFI96_000369 [Prochilodus magdalenae]
MAALRLLLLSAVVLLLSAVTFTEGMRYGSAPKSCCFDFVRQPVKLNMVRSYSYTSQQCSKQAVLVNDWWIRSGGDDAYSLAGPGWKEK